MWFKDQRPQLARNVEFHSIPGTESAFLSRSPDDNQNLRSPSLISQLNDKKSGVMMIELSYKEVKTSEQSHRANGTE